MSRLERIELFHVDMPLAEPFWPSWIPGYPQTHNRFTLIRLTTDDGLTGVSAGAAFTTERQGLGDLLGGFLLGLDPMDIATVRQRIKEASYLGWRNWWIEPAFWDLRGKIEGRPVYQLLTGSDARVEKVPCYASTGSLRSFDERKPYLDDIREKGFRGVKIRVHSFDEEEDFEILRRVREEVGAEFQVMVDANQGWRVTLIDDAPLWDLERATRFGRVADELRFAWIEEPLDMHRFDEYAELRRRIETPIAGGELFGSRQEMRTALDKGAFDILQPDATFAGGIEDGRWAIAECLERGIGYSPHTWTNGIGLLINLHLKAAAGTDDLLEYPYEPPGWTPEGRDGLLAATVGVDGQGAVSVPQAPGLGILLDDRKVSRFARRFHLMTPSRLAVKTIRERIENRDGTQKKKSGERAPDVTAPREIGREFSFQDAIGHPLKRTWSVFRNELPGLAEYLPNVRHIEEIERTKVDGGVHVVLKWFAEAKLPGLAARLIAPEKIYWIDTATWFDEAHTVEYELTLPELTGAVRVVGTNRFIDGGERTVVHLSGALYTDIDKIKGVPKAVLRTVVPAVEAFALKLTEPNLRQLNRGLGHYLDRLDGRASRTP